MAGPWRRKQGPRLHLWQTVAGKHSCCSYPVSALPPSPPTPVYTSVAAMVACLRLAGRLLLGAHSSSPTQTQPEQPINPVGSSEQQLALPSIRTKSPVKEHSSGVGTPAGASPAASLRKLNPAAAAAAALSDTHSTAPAVSSAVLEATAAAVYHHQLSPFASPRKSLVEGGVDGSGAAGSKVRRGGWPAL